MCLINTDMSNIDWNKTHDLVEIVFLFVQIFLTTVLTWKIISQTKKYSEIEFKQRKYETKILLFDKRIEVYSLCNYIIDLVGNLINCNKDDFEVYFQNFTINIKSQITITDENDNHQLSSEYMNNYKKILAADIIFKKELIYPFSDCYKNVLNFIIYYGFKKYDLIKNDPMVNEKMEEIKANYNSMIKSIEIIKNSLRIDDTE